MSDENSDGVVRLASQQRAAGHDDPTCAICGRFGEYVCDATDEDVCSLECRDICTQRQRPQPEKDLVTIGGGAVAAVAADERGAAAKRKAPADGDEIESVELESPADAALAAEARKRLKIHVELVGKSEESLPSLCCSFEPLPGQLRNNLTSKGFDLPTPVQMQTIPAVLAGHHVLVSAPTGTGKTASFLVPLLVLIMEARFDTETSVPLGLVLAPIRELAIQIEDEAKSLMKGIVMMKTALLVGGLPVPPQLHRLRQGVQLIVATPGRLLDVLLHHCEDDYMEQLLDCVRCCVVDEVDMMLSVGFRDGIAQIMAMLLSLNTNVQLVFTSATVSKQVESIVANCLGAAPTYVRIHVGEVATSSSTTGVTLNAHVNHKVLWLEENAKKAQLFSFLQQRGVQQTLVFVDSKPGADMLALAIQKQVKSVKARSFHAGKSQQERLQILEDFVEENVHVLVSTNVLGRGIDLLSVDSVVIFDAPPTTDEFVHLAGRAGRNIAKDDEGTLSATAVLYVNNRDTKIFADLAQICQKRGIHVPEQVFSHLRAAHSKQQRHQKVSVVMDDAKKAFTVLSELESCDVTDRARTWASWNYSSKRSRLV